MLAFISRQDGLPQTQLANELDVGKVALGALIDRLESAGFVARRADPIDRRVKRVFLTKQVGRFLRRIRGEADIFNTRIVNGIDRAALERTSDTLFAMKRNLLAMANGASLPGEIDEDELQEKPKPRKLTKPIEYLR